MPYEIVDHFPEVEKLWFSVNESEAVLNKAHSVQALGLRSKDALHVACAIEATADYFVTTDDLLIKKLRDLGEIQVVTPLEFVDCLEGRQ